MSYSPNKRAGEGSQTLFILIGSQEHSSWCATRKLFCAPGGIRTHNTCFKGAVLSLTLANWSYGGKKPKTNMSKTLIFISAVRWGRTTISEFSVQHIGLLCYHREFYNKKAELFLEVPLNYRNFVFYLI